MKIDLKFKLDKELDKKMALEFLDINVAGVDFSKGITSIHPTIKNIKDKPKEERCVIINDYFDEFYKDNEKELAGKVKGFGLSWTLVEDELIEQLNKIFKDKNILDLKCTGYLSIINCNPRFIGDKSFQVFYKHKAGSNYIAVHEIMHFLFYDYSLKKYPEIFSKLDTDDGVWWDLAELFNSVILDLPEFISLHENKDNKPYPEHEKYIEFMKKLWEDTKNIDKWIIGAYNYLTKKYAK